METRDTTSGPADPYDRLFPQHRRLIDASAIDLEIARQRGYCSVTTKAELEKLRFSRIQQNVPALLIPQWTVHGDIGGYQIRSDDPRIDKNGKRLKYESPSKSTPVLDVPPAIRDKLRNRDTPLWITEGSRKADSAVSKGLCCISIPGVWGWKEKGVPLAAWDEILLKSRAIYLAFDSDVLTKPNVYTALFRFKRFLEGRGGEVNVVVLPPLTDGTQ